MIFLDFKMLILIEKESPFFDKETAKEHFTLNRDNLDDTDGFEALLDAGLFYNVYSRGYVGSIFAYQSTDGRWYMGGFFYALKAGRVCKCVQYGAMWHKCVQHGAKQGKKIHHDTRQTAGFKYKIRYEINIYERKKQDVRKNECNGKYRRLGRRGCHRPSR